MVIPEPPKIEKVKVVGNPSYSRYQIKINYNYSASPRKAGVDTKRTLQKLGRIENSLHIPRGLLEFSIHPESAFVQNNQIDLNKETVLFCAAGGRSALAAKTLQEMGFKNISHIDGGFGLMRQKGFKTKS